MQEKEEKAISQWTIKADYIEKHSWIRRVR